MTRVALLLALLLAPFSAAAQEPMVEVELVLLADASRSIDDAEITFQRRGYATAITDPSVIAAIRGSGLGRIAVTYVEWGGVDSQEIVAPWMIIEDEFTAETFALALRSPARRARGRNALGAALLTALDMIETNNITARRKVIDLSSDTVNSWEGPQIEPSREKVLNAGVTINGLPILCRYCNGRPHGVGDLEKQYQERIIGGPGAFMVTADGSEPFANAIARKLILEISGLTPTNRYAALEDLLPTLR